MGRRERLCLAAAEGLDLLAMELARARAAAAREAGERAAALVAAGDAYERACRARRALHPSRAAALLAAVARGLGFLLGHVLRVVPLGSRRLEARAGALAGRWGRAPGRAGDEQGSGRAA